MAGDAEGIANTGVHLWGHPTYLEIQHWIPLYGYAASGARTSYVDPVAGSPLNWPVNAYNPGFASSDMYTLVTDADPMGGPYGIVW